MKYIVYSLSIIVLFASCKKLQDVQSQEDVLRAGKWKFASSTSTQKNPFGSGDTTITLTPKDLPDCQKDDYLVFGDNYNGYQATGANKCTPGEPDQLGFNWGLLDNDTKMYIYNAAQLFQTPSVNATVITLNSSTLTLGFNVTHPDGLNPDQTDTIKLKATFTRF